MALDKETSDFIESQNSIMRTHMTEIIGLNTTVISARLDNKMDEKLGPITTTIDSIRSHQEAQNGWIQNHSIRIGASEDDVLDIQLHCQNTDTVFNFAKKRWYILVILYLLVNLSTYVLYHNVDLRQTFENKTGIDLIDEPRGN